MRFGLIGSNVIVSQFLAAAKQCDGFVLQATCSRDLEHARLNARVWGAVSAYGDVEALAADPLVDAVYIASPNLFHFAQAKTMLEAGKHVLVEKPAALSRAEWEVLTTLAREKNKLILEAMRPAFLPGLTAVREAMEEIKPIRYAQFSYCQYSSRYDKFKAGIVENAFDPTLGNGALMDIGVYCVHWMVALFGRPEAVRGSAAFVPMSIDGLGSTTAHYDGLLVDCVYSKIHASAVPCRLEGEGGVIELSPFPLPNHMRLTSRMDGSVREMSFGHREHDITYEIEAFMALCAQPEQAVQHQRQTMDALWVLDAIRTQTGIDFVPKPDRNR